MPKTSFRKNSGALDSVLIIPTTLFRC